MDYLYKLSDWKCVAKNNKIFTSTTYFQSTVCNVENARPFYRPSHGIFATPALALFPFNRPVGPGGPPPATKLHRLIPASISHPCYDSVFPLPLSRPISNQSVGGTSFSTATYIRLAADSIEEGTCGGLTFSPFCFRLYFVEL